MKWLLDDGDLWLLAMLFAAGVMPVVSDVVRHRVLGAEATLGGLLAVVSAVALLRRLFTHLGASSLTHRLLHRK